MRGTVGSVASPIRVANDVRRPAAMIMAGRGSLRCRAIRQSNYGTKSKRQKYTFCVNKNVRARCNFIVSHCLTTLNRTRSALMYMQLQREPSLSLRGACNGSLVLTRDFQMTNGRIATTAFSIALIRCHSSEAPAFNQFMEDCLSKLKAERLRTEQRTQYMQ